MNLKINKNYILIAVIVFFVVLINSMASPLYDISMLNDDAHIFYVVGRGIKNGKIAYVDIFDHKGLYIFFVAFLGSLIEYKHIGLFLVLYLCVFFTSLVVYKILRLFINDIHSVLGGIAVAILQVSFYYSLGAFECETFALLFIFLSYYLLLKYLLNVDKGDCEHKNKYMFLQGLFFGITLLLKSNVTIIWGGIGLCILIILIKNKLYKNIVLNILYGFLGVIMGLLPAIIYCVYNNCLYEMIEGTFIFNAKYMSNKIYEYESIFDYILVLLFNYKYVIIFTVISLVVVIKSKVISDAIKKIYIFMYVVSVFTILILRRPYSYYNNIMMIFFIPFIVFMCKKIDALFVDINIKKAVNIIVVVLLCCFSIVIGRNASIERQIHLQNASAAIKNVYNQNFKNKKNVEVYGIGDPAFMYNVLDVLPKEKYFCTPKAMYDDIPEFYEEIYDYLLSKKSDFVVVCLNNVLVKNEEITKRYFNVLNNNYDLISDELGLYMYKKRK